MDTLQKTFLGVASPDRKLEDLQDCGNSGERVKI